MMKALIKSVFFTMLLFVLTLSIYAQQSDSSSIRHSQQQADSSQAEQLYAQAIREISYHNLEDASDYLNQVLILNPKHDAALFALTRIYFSQNKFREATLMARRATEINPTNEKYWIALADIYKTTKDYSALLIVFDHIIQLKPEAEGYYLDKAYTLVLNNEYNEALALYNAIEQKFGIDKIGRAHV